MINKLQKLQNRAARAITRSNYDASATFLLNLLNWDDLIIRRQKLKAILMFKTINGFTLAYLLNLFSNAVRNTTLESRGYLSCVCRAQLRTSYGKRAFCYSGALLWNSLPSSLRKSDSLIVGAGRAPTRQSCKTV